VRLRGRHPGRRDKPAKSGETSVRNQWLRRLVSRRPSCLIPQTCTDDRAFGDSACMCCNSARVAVRGASLGSRACELVRLLTPSAVPKCVGPPRPPRLPRSALPVFRAQLPGGGRRGPAPANSSDSNSRSRNRPSPAPGSGDRNVTREHSDPSFVTEGLVVNPYVTRGAGTEPNVTFRSR